MDLFVENENRETEAEGGGDEMGAVFDLKYRVEALKKAIEGDWDVE